MIAPNLRNLIQIVEGAAAPLTEKVGDHFLFHSTFAPAADAILMADKLAALSDHMVRPHLGFRKKDRPNESGYVKGVCLTRSLQFAREWRKGGVVFVLDAQKIRHRHRMVPIDYYKDRREAEEFVVGEIQPLSSYLLAILMSAEAYDECVAENDEWEEGHKPYELLVAHPKLKVAGRLVNESGRGRIS